MEVYLYGIYHLDNRALGFNWKFKHVRFRYSSFKNKVFGFQKPLHLGLWCKVMLSNFTKWSILYCQGAISASWISKAKLELITKYSLQKHSVFLRRHMCICVYDPLSVISVKFNSSHSSLTILKAFFWVLGKAPQNMSIYVDGQKIAWRRLGGSKSAFS